MPAIVPSDGTWLKSIQANKTVKTFPNPAQMAYATAIGITVITFDKNQNDNPYKIKATKPQPICWNPEDFPKLIVPNTSAQIEMIRRKNGEKVIVVIITSNKPNIRYV